jgi:GTP cyclohydrolase I
MSNASNDLVASKSNKDLGEKVRAHLLEQGIETPINPEKIAMSDDEKMDIIEQHMKGILETLGLDLADDSLMDTPRRVAKMYVLETFRGLTTEAFPKCTTVENKFSHG